MTWSRESDDGGGEPVVRVRVERYGRKGLRHRICAVGLCSMSGATRAWDLGKWESWNGRNRWESVY